MSIRREQGAAVPPRCEAMRCNGGMRRVEGKGTEVLFVLSNLMMKVTMRDERVTIYTSSPSRLLIKPSVPTTPQHWAATRTKSHLFHPDTTTHHNPLPSSTSLASSSVHLMNSLNLSVRTLAISLPFSVFIIPSNLTNLSSKCEIASPPGSPGGGKECDEEEDEGRWSGRFVAAE